MRSIVHGSLLHSLTLWCLVRGKGHGGGDQSKKGDKLEGLHGEILLLLL
jgi:hypothetical protein